MYIVGLQAGRRTIPSSQGPLDDLGSLALYGRREVNHDRLKWIILIVLLGSVLTLGGCKKKVATPPQAPPPPPAAPTASLSASPDTIQAGQSSTLTWQTQNATDVTLDGNTAGRGWRRSKFRRK